MLFRKLFQMLVLGGAALGLNAGCSTAQAQPSEKKQDARSATDGGTGDRQSSDQRADAGGGGSGVQGW
jgi:hypothetical protein